MRNAGSCKKQFLFFVSIAVFIFIALGTCMVYGADTNPTNYQGAGYCVECHPQQAEAWDESPHATSFTNTEFQTTWKELGSPEDCVSCHVTGYVEGEGYAISSVSCEACHGPGSNMKIDKSVNLCASCHTYPYPTYEEWKQSGPSHANATCYSCHDQHTTKLLYGTPEATCGQCHEPHVKAVDATLHGDNNVDCIDCHMTFIPADFVKGTPADTGHSFTTSAAHLDCTTCHDVQLVTHSQLGVKEYACLSCHGDIHELKLQLINGTILDLNDSSKLCGECHNQRYIWWKEGIHVETHEANSQAQCTDCHQPHDPKITGIETLPYIPPREPGPQANLFLVTSVVVVIEILILAAFIMRGRNNG